MFARHVQEIDSDIDRLANDGYSLRRVLINTKVVAAQPDDPRPYSGAPKFSHFHTKTPYSRSGGPDSTWRHGCQACWTLRCKNALDPAVCECIEAQQTATTRGRDFPGR